MSDKRLMYSAYELADDNVWVGVHRLPLNIAISYCKEFRARRHCEVALVPDNKDPQPYFKLVQKLA